MKYSLLTICTCYSSLVDLVYRGSYLLAFWSFSTSTPTTSLPVEQLTLVPCLQHSCLLPVLWVLLHILEPWFLPSFLTSWAALHTMELDPHLFSMVPTMYLWPNGGAMGSSYLLSTLLSGLGLEEFGGRPLACGRELIMKIRRPKTCGIPTLIRPQKRLSHLDLLSGERLLVFVPNLFHRNNLFVALVETSVRKMVYA